MRFRQVPGAPALKTVTFEADHAVGLDLEESETEKTIIVKSAIATGAAAKVCASASERGDPSVRAAAFNDKRVRVHCAVQAGIGKDWTVVKLNNDKLPSGLNIDSFAKQVRLG